MAKIQTALGKRAAHGPNAQREPCRLGGLTIDYAGRNVFVNNRPAELPATWYALLKALSVNAGRVLSYDQLLRQGRGMEPMGELLKEE